MIKPFVQLGSIPAETPPINIRDLQLLAEFVNARNKAQLSTNTLKFGGKAAGRIRDFALGGLDGSTEGATSGMPVNISIENTITGDLVDGFTGFIDWRKPHKIGGANQIAEVQLSLERGLIEFEQIASGATFGFLHEMGHDAALGFQQRPGAIFQSDYKTVPYFFAPLFDQAGEALLYTAILSLAMQASQIALEIVNIVSVLASPAANAAFGMALGLLGKIIQLGLDLRNFADNIFPLIFHAKRYRKVVSWRTMLEKACAYCGNYTFSSSITQLDRAHFYSSNKEKGNKVPNFIGSGVPNNNDSGYIILDFLNEMKKHFEGDFRIIGNTIHFEPFKNDSFWLQNGSLNIDDIKQPIDEGYELNIGEVKAMTYFEFNTDDTDSYTRIRNVQRGHEMQAIPIQQANVKMTTLTGGEVLKSPWSLASRKNELTSFEEVVLKFLKVIDTVTGVIDNIINSVITAINAMIDAVNGIINAINIILPKSAEISEVQAISPANIATNYEEDFINNRIGGIIQSEHENSIAKAVWLKETPETNGTYEMPSNHREKWSSKVIVDNWVNVRSMVEENYRNQWRHYKNILIPMGLSRFKNTLDNNYFNFGGKLARINILAWSFMKDTGVIDFSVRDKYTINVQSKRV